MAKHDTNRRGMIGTCVTGKVCYDKKAAKARVRYLRKRDTQTHRGHLSAFKCREAMCVYWHIGHLPKAVEDGDASRASIKRRDEVR